MKYKLIDVIRKFEENVEFGTCDVCQYLGTLSYDVLVFEDENGNVYKEENGEWHWGEYDKKWEIKNYVNFASFITGREFPEPKKNEYGEYEFSKVVDFMYCDYTDY